MALTSPEPCPSSAASESLNGIQTQCSDYSLQQEDLSSQLPAVDTAVKASSLNMSKEGNRKRIANISLGKVNSL